MVFSSFVFLFLFLPAVLLLYHLCPAHGRNAVLFAASLLFYAWGEPVYVLIMLFSTVFDYMNGRLIGHFQAKGKRAAAKGILIADICGNLGILGFFKYADFLIGTVNAVSGAGLSLLRIALPVGISFYTFQTMSYTIDVYRGIVPAQKNILTFGTYVTMFPQLIAGPIVQYKTIGEELENREITVRDFSEGAFRFTVGLAKKVLLANQAGSLADAVFATDTLTAASAWLGALAYTFQIYYDFSGYSDMAIGLGRMFGFHFPENFDHPYLAKSVTEFWRRWHISLSSWFREYVYIPLGGNRRGLAVQLRNILIVWMLTGLWHGANWNFVLWGLYYSVLLILEKLVFSRRRRREAVEMDSENHGGSSRFPIEVGRMAKNVCCHIYTMFVIVVGWVIFSQTEPEGLAGYLKAMVGIGVQPVNSDFFYYLSCNGVLFAVLVLCAPDWSAVRKKAEGMSAGVAKASCGVGKAVLLLLLFGLSLAFLTGESYNPFLYFRF